MEEVLTAISTCGFPIVMCLIEAWYIMKRADAMTSALENNTKAIEKLELLIASDQEVIENEC